MLGSTDTPGGNGRPVRGSTGRGVDGWVVGNPVLGSIVLAGGTVVGGLGVVGGLADGN